MDENKNKEAPSNVDINRYILKKSYELFERIIKKYFNEKLYVENYMKNMIEINNYIYLFLPIIFLILYIAIFA